MISRQIILLVGSIILLILALANFGAVLEAVIVIAVFAFLVSGLYYVANKYGTV